MYTATITSARYVVIVKMRVVETPESVGGDYGGIGSEMTRSGSGELTVHDTKTGELIVAMIVYYSQTGTNGTIRNVDDESFKSCVEKSAVVEAMQFSKLANSLITSFKTTKEGVGIPRMSLEEVFKAR
jgi:hypothetical protein